MRASQALLRLVLALVGLVPAAAEALDEFESPPIAYSASTPENRISRLQAELDAGATTLTYDDARGYLPALLAALEIPVESQMLVFSKTSLQLRRISPRTPRAVYFRDDVYVGFCQAGDVLEISAVDPQLGAVFYTLDQRAPQGVPRFERQTENCLVCHSSSRTEGVPGHLVRSLYVEESGYPVLSAGSRTVDHTTPLADRWGGWYVTGEHGDQRHLGNLIVEGLPLPANVDNSAGLNLLSLAERLNTAPYLTPHSDIVALMVLEHQVLVHNRLTQANYTTRQALAYNAMMNEALKHPPETRLESTTRRIRNAGEKLVEALLLVDEAPLTAPIRGTSGFAERFSAQGPRDSHGRSLYDLDLARRMFQFPCSYLIYSEAFRQLPNELREYVWQRLQAILAGEETSPRFAHLSPEERQAIYEILGETLAEAPWSPRR